MKKSQKRIKKNRDLRVLEPTTYREELQWVISGLLLLGAYSEYQPLG